MCEGTSLLNKTAKRTSVRAATGLDVRAQISATATPETVKVRFSTHFQVRNLLRCLAKGRCIQRALVLASPLLCAMLLGRTTVLHLVSHHPKATRY